MTDFPDRHTYLGASEVSVIMGANPWKSPTELAIEKRTRQQWEGNELTEWGTVLEPVVIEQFERRYGVTVYGQQDVFTDPEYSFLRCHIDGCMLTSGGEVLVEVKTTRVAPWADAPEYYRQQVMVQMGLSGVHQGVIVALHQGSAMCVYRIHWDSKEWMRIRARCVDWWQRHIIGDDEVVPISADEARQFGPRGKRDEVATASAEMMKHINGYRQCQKHIEETKKLQDAHELKIVLGFGAAERLQDAAGDTVATFRQTSDYRRFSTGLAKNLLTPEQIESCMTPVTGVRRLKIK